VTAAAASSEPVRTRRSFRGWRVPPSVVVSFLVLLAMAVFAVFGELVAPENPRALRIELISAPPSWDHWLGTDDLGRDVFSRLIVGTRTALGGALLVAAGAMAVGVIFGLLAGYWGGKVDGTIMRVVDFLYSLPGLLIVLVVVGVAGGGFWLTVGLLTLLTAPYDTRLVRGATLEQRPRHYVEAALVTGARHWRIMLRHIWPNITPLIVANTLLNFGFAIVGLTGLAFLGVGSAPGAPDWGRMLADTRTLLFTNPAAPLGPAVAIALVACAANIVGDWVLERSRPT
jgi:peptide/nickel transport system permease protein